MAKDLYTWDMTLIVSGNAVNFLKYLLENYSPEPWEAELRKNLLEQLTQLQDFEKMIENEEEIS